jgi:glycosyltransferase involved in cell wall biosynthesis
VASPPAVRARLRSELGGDGAIVLLVPARLHPEKGHTLLFQALQALRDTSGGRFLALIAGAGPFAAAYAAEVRERRIEPEVRFLGYRHDVADLMAISDAVVLPSVAEAFGLVLVEALYLGTPVIATRVGGIPEIVADGIDGMLVPPGDASALAETLRAFAANPGLRERLRGAGSARMQERFAFPAMMRAYEALYEELLGRRS